MSNPYRAMCVELADLLERSASALETYEISKRASRGVAAAHRARALLAQPELPELTDEVLLQMLFDNHRGAIEFLCDTEEEAHLMIRNHVKFAIAAIAAAADRARRPTPQPEPPELTDEKLLRLAAKAFGYVFLDGGLGGGESEFLAYGRAVCAQQLLARRPTPQPEPPERIEPVRADIHYAWELLDAEDEWQAGGSANSLEDVQREGARYLQVYSQDGPHKLVIQQHCVNTIEEVTNA